MLIYQVCQENVQSIQDQLTQSNEKNTPQTIYHPDFTRNKTAATKPLPIEKALKTDVMTILTVYQQ